MSATALPGSHSLLNFNTTPQQSRLTQMPSEQDPAFNVRPKMSHKPANSMTLLQASKSPKRLSNMQTSNASSKLFHTATPSFAVTPSAKVSNKKQHEERKRTNYI